jgi:hypothetical protein
MVPGKNKYPVSNGLEKLNALLKDVQQGINLNLCLIHSIIYHLYVYDIQFCTSNQVLFSLSFLFVTVYPMGGFLPSLPASLLSSPLLSSPLLSSPPLPSPPLPSSPLPFPPLLLFFFLLLLLSLSLSPSLFLFLFETGFLCVALAVLELALWNRLALNSELLLPQPLSAGIKGMHHARLNSSALYCAFIEQHNKNPTCPA